jgi:hypothetical protein
MTKMVLLQFLSHAKGNGSSHPCYDSLCFAETESGQLNIISFSLQWKKMFSWLQPPLQTPHFPSERWLYNWWLNQ